MKLIIATMVVCMLCLSTACLWADNEAVDRGSIEFGLGTIFNLVMTFGNFQGTEFTVGSGWTRFNIGYFIGDRFFVGGAVSYYWQRDQGDTDAYTDLYFGPVVKYYLVASKRILCDFKASIRVSGSIHVQLI